MKYHPLPKATDMEMLSADIKVGDKVVLSGNTYQVIEVNGRSCVFSKDGARATFRLTHGEVRNLIKKGSIR